MLPACRTLWLARWHKPVSSRPGTRVLHGAACPSGAQRVLVAVASGSPAERGTPRAASALRGCEREADTAKGSVLFDPYHHFSPSVSLFQIAERRRGLTQVVSPVDDRVHLTGLHESAQGGQIVFVEFRQNHAELLTRSEEHTSELQSHSDIVCRLLLEKKNRMQLRHRHSQD